MEGDPERGQQLCSRSIQETLPGTHSPAVNKRNYVETRHGSAYAHILHIPALPTSSTPEISRDTQATGCIQVCHIPKVRQGFVFLE